MVASAPGGKRGSRSDRPRSLSLSRYAVPTVELTPGLVDTAGTPRVMADEDTQRSAAPLVACRT